MLRLCALIYRNSIGRIGEKFPIAQKERARMTMGLKEIEEYASQARQFRAQTASEKD